MDNIWNALPGDLGRDERLWLVRRLQARPGTWRHLVQHDPSRRIYQELWRGDHVAAAGSARRGSRSEERPLVRTLGAGETFDFRSRGRAARPACGLVRRGAAAAL